MVFYWERQKGLPLAAIAWLWRWENHALPFGELVSRDPEGLAALLRLARHLCDETIRRRLIGTPSKDGSAATSQLAEQAPDTDIVGVRGRRRRVLGFVGDERSPVARRRLIGV